jgi:hypothetical protein
MITPNKLIRIKQDIKWNSNKCDYKYINANQWDMDDFFININHTVFIDGHIGLIFHNPFDWSPCID